MNTGGPCRCCSGRQQVDIRKSRSFTGSIRESDLLIVPLVSQRQHNSGRGKGQYLHHVSEGEKERRLSALGRLVTPYISRSSEETIPGCQAGGCERLWKKMIGKPYSGKPNVRFEAAGNGKVLLVIPEVTRHSLTLQYSTGINNITM